MRFPLDLRTGAAAAWVDTIEKFGSGKFSMSDVLEPAIRLAEDGYNNYPVYPCPF
jgi:gamma-glutamyltranspeptidase